MKKWVALLGGAMFCVLFFSMYMVVDQLGKTPNYREAFETKVHQLRTEGKSSNYVESVQGKTSDGVDDGCVFSRVRSWKSTDVKMLDALDVIPFDNPDGGAWKQGWPITYDDHSFDEQPLKVFVVPHSHNDPGWIKTYQQYFHDQTRHILHNIVDALDEDKRRKFIWAEISYFSLWWSSIDEGTRSRALKLIKNGQLEIVTGGWVMNDEANPHFYSMLDQMIEGHQWIKNNLGEDIKPISGWAIDPFGHTPTMAYLLKRMGFNNMLIQRVHYQVKKYLAKTADLEFMWRQTWDHGSSTDIFCHMMPFYSYDVPHTCGPDPKICCQFDFRRLPGGGITCPWRVPPVPITDANVADRAQTLVDQYKKKAQLYKTNVLFVPLGDDFRYEKKFETHAQYTNYQKLFDYINSHPKLKTQAQFGTLSEYFNAIYKRTGTEPGQKPSKLKTLSGDFFTYSDRDDHYWSGYYTSRPFYKNLDRVMESHHRAAEVLFYLAHSRAKQKGSVSFASDELYKLLTKARQNMGLFQHHDGITGTAKDFVVVDYGNRLHKSLRDMQQVMKDSAHFLLLKDKAESPGNHVPRLKIAEERLAQDSIPQKETIIVSSTPRSVVFYNPLSRPRSDVVSLYVSSPRVTVKDSDGNVVPSQTNLAWDDDHKISSTRYKLVFVANTTPLGLSMYHIKEGSRDNDEHHTAKLTAYTRQSEIPKPNEEFSFQTKASGSETISIENEDIMAEFDSSSGFLKSITDKADKSRTDINIEFVTYGTKGYGDKSGAYLFLPDGPAKPHSPLEEVTVYVTKGKVMQEVRVAFPNVLHVVRIYSVDGPESKMLDIQNTVDIRSASNKEFVMRVTSNIKNPNREFFTDLNGFTIQKRKTLDKLPIQANFYPMPSMAFLQDRTKRLSLLSAQPNGVASLQPGSLEVVLDRRLSQDDNRGLGQGVLDNKRTPSNFRLLLERFKDTGKDAPKRETLVYPSLLGHRLSDHLLRPQFTFYTQAETSDAYGKLLPSFSGLTTPLPCDVSLLMLRTIQDGAASRPSDEALMIVHRRGYDCSVINKCLKNTSLGKVILGNLFKGLSMSELNAVTLTMLHEQEKKDPSTPVKLDPMELYSFRVKLS
ncbi:alpha-mannosidase 2x-like isoform X2 [Actinia tenebrosa]|uniref:Alpha-mannosidase n=1 Tax=Actinia tenebrosa TaxID=6105 RepID=A0A6P8I5Q8_ACTTE|nr:alpha-mannosidase 2x-like isoform X2 [Actinia tenebrosa]